MMWPSYLCAIRRVARKDWIASSRSPKPAPELVIDVCSAPADDEAGVRDAPTTAAETAALQMRRGVLNQWELE
jgi:hypothetical protein